MFRVFEMFVVTQVFACVGACFLDAELTMCRMSDRFEDPSFDLVSVLSETLVAGESGALLLAPLLARVSSEHGDNAVFAALSDALSDARTSDGASNVLLCVALCEHDSLTVNLFATFLCDWAPKSVPVGVRAELAQLMVSASRLLVDATPEGHSDHVGALEDLCRALNNAGDCVLQTAFGDLVLAEGLYAEALSIRRHLSATHKPAQHGLCVALGRSASVAMYRANVDQAAVLLNEALVIRRARATLNSDDAATLRELSAVLEHLGDVLSFADLRYSGGPVPELAAIGVEFDLVQKFLASADAMSVENQRALSAAVAQSVSSFVFRPNRHSDSAQALYAEALTVRRLLAEQDVEDLVARRDLSVALGKVSDGLVWDGEMGAALVLRDEMLSIRRSLLVCDPDDFGGMHDLTVALSLFGESALAGNDFVAAEVLFREAFEILVLLVAADPLNVLAQRDLSVATLRLSSVALSLGNLVQATILASQALDAARVLHVGNPGHVFAARYLALVLDSTAVVLLRGGDVVAATLLWLEASALVVKTEYQVLLSELRPVFAKRVVAVSEMLVPDSELVVSCNLVLAELVAF